MQTVGLRKLVARTGERYVALAQDRARRLGLSNGMRQRLEASPLFDYAGYTRRQEAGLGQAW